MAVISLSSAQLAFGHVALLDHADFSLETGERVGLIGRNGTGKSSLLKIISGRSKLDDGLLVMQQNVKIAYVEQEPVFDPEMTVFDAVATGMGDQQAMLAEYESLTGQFGQGNDDAVMERMHDLQVKLDATDAWNLGNRVETTLGRLGLAGFRRELPRPERLEKLAALVCGQSTVKGIRVGKRGSRSEPFEKRSR